GGEGGGVGVAAAAGAGDYQERSRGGRWDPAAGAFVVDAVMSPAIDAGDPASDHSLEILPNGGRVNLGAFGNTPEASRSAPAAATQLRFGPMPASARAGQPLPAVRVSVTDALGTAVSS